MTRTRRDRSLLALGIAIGGALGTGLVRYIVQGGLPRADASLIAATFVIQYAVAIAVGRVLYRLIKPSTQEDTNDDDR